MNELETKITSITTDLVDTLIATNDDIDKFGLQDCEKEEVTDDEQ